MVGQIRCPVCVKALSGNLRRALFCINMERAAYQAMLPPAASIRDVAACLLLASILLFLDPQVGLHM